MISGPKDSMNSSQHCQGHSFSSLYAHLLVASRLLDSELNSTQWKARSLVCHPPRKELKKESNLTLSTVSPIIDYCLQSHSDAIPTRRIETCTDWVPITIIRGRSWSMAFFASALCSPANSIDLVGFTEDRDWLQVTQRLNHMIKSITVSLSSSWQK